MENSKYVFRKRDISILEKNKYYINKIPYMRWSQAWALFGLSEYFLLNEND